MPSALRLTDILADIEQRLFLETPLAVKRGAQGWTSPPWCCALVFDSSQLLLPPEIALTTVAERDDAIRQSKAVGKKRIWNAVAFDGVGAGWYSDKKLLAACALASERLQEKQMTLPATKLVVRLAKRLNALPTTAFGAVPDDFVTYACDRNEPATKFVAASLTARKRAALQRRQLL
jgi:hypothetical protein